MTICTHLPQLHGLTGCDTTSFFFKVGKVSPFNKVLKNIPLISAFGVNTILSDEYVEDCKRFIQIVMYAGDNKGTYVDTRIRLFKQQRTETTMRIPPEADSAKQAIHRVDHQVYTWLRCTGKWIEPIPYEENEWKHDVEEDYLKPVWFTRPQFPSSVTKRRKRKSTIPHDGYEADCDEGGRSKTRGKMKTVILPSNL